MSDRDPQRYAVYKAEDEARGKTAKKLNPVACQMFVNDIRSHPVLRKKYGPALEERIQLVLKGKTATRVSAYFFIGKIFLPDWAQTDWVICHEVAHLVRSRMGKEQDEQSHGPEFCRTNLDIIECLIGKDAANNLRDAYAKHEVKF